MIDRQALKSEAKQNMTGKKPNVFLVAAIYVAAISVLSVLLYNLSGYQQFLNYIQQIFPVNPNPTYEEIAAAVPTITTMAGILMISVLVCRTVIDAGYTGYCLKIARREDTDIKTIFDGFTLFFRIIWLMALQYIIIILSSFLLIVPGIIAYYKYRQAIYILLDNPEKSPLVCLRESTHMMNGRKADLFFLDLSFFGWRVFDVIINIYTTIPLLSIWLAPYTGVTYAGFYNQLVSGGVTAKDAG